MSMLLILAASTLSYAAPQEDTEESISALSVQKTLDALIALADAAFAEALAPFDEELYGTNLTVYDNIAAQHDVFIRMARALSDSLSHFYLEAVQIVCRDLRVLNIPLMDVTRERSVLNWQEAASLYRAYGADMSTRLAQGLDLTLSLEDGGAQFRCSFGENDRLFAAGTREELLAAHFTLYYLYTVYDDNGERTNGETAELPEAYLNTLIHPLPGCLIKNGWYSPRSHHTRLHTGTDIRARRGTGIQSVTNGTVLYIGFSAIPGYYVIIRDALGYEYHYYHMVRQTEHVKEGDTVEQGQIIGLVGSTGNSDANHLHLAIVTPEGRYINPYDVFKQAGIGPIRSQRY